MEHQIAVVIPFYNGSRFIERAVVSAKRQTIPPSELIVVNDGSRPEEREFLGELATRYDITIIDKDNGGQGDARNAGAAAATSPYICFLDQDDAFLDTHIADLLASIAENDPHYGYSYGDLFEADAAGRIMKRSCLNPADHPKKTLLDCLRKDMYILPSATLISRCSFLDVGGFDPQFRGYEDDDLFLRFFLAGYTSIYIEKPVTIWTIHAGSTSYSPLIAQSRWKYFTKLVDMFPDDPLRDTYYVGDILIPRFCVSFVQDVVTATLSRVDTRPQARGTLDAFMRIVRESSGYAVGQRCLLRLAAYVVQHVPENILRALLRDTPGNFFRRSILVVVRRVFRVRI